MDYYDLTIIGSGWAGFNAALRAKAHGLKVALIEKEQIGGTCLNRGCIPTKTLLQSAKIYNLAKKSKAFGIETGIPQINFPEIQARKNKIIQQLRQGMERMLRGIDFLNTQALILSKNTLEIEKKQINTKFMLVATGSKPLELKDIKFDGKKIISSNEILDLKEIPSSLLIIGGGVIGCEFASLFSTFGCLVSIVELTPQLLPGIDKEIAKRLEAVFKKKGIKVATNTNAINLDLSHYDLVLLCVGRTCVTEELGLDKLGVKLEKSRIIVDEYLKTSISNIYAAGDCASKICLAHFAAYLGCIAAENIADPSHLKKFNDSNIPNCIFTDPEIGSVGLTEEEAKSKDANIKVHKFDFLGSGMARILDETEGFIKIISDNKTEEILGASIIGPRATELIGILTVAIQSRLLVSQVENTILAHPTLSESIISALKEEHGL
ncbi:MAG: dihydrolipoyl dehydrogenase [Candidatus Omnitrophota bacterium]|nr:dihydrolipoyl dehydrogenase [Candidatus Omnitrophota bacterium]